MQNDVLKNQIAPWQDKGRWYKLTFDWNFSSQHRTIYDNETDQFILDRIIAEPNIPNLLFLRRDDHIIIDVKIDYIETTGENVTYNLNQLIDSVNSSQIAPTMEQSYPLVIDIPGNYELIKISIWLYIK